MALSLEEYLATLRGAGQDLGQAFDRLAAVEKQQATGRVYEQAPQMIEAGEIGQLGSQLASLGDPEILRSQLQQQAKAKAQPSLDAEALIGLGANPNQAGILASLPQDQQLSTLNQLKQNTISQGNLSLSQRAQTRLEREEDQKQRKGLAAVNKLEQKFKDDADKLETATTLLDQGNAIADNAVAFFLARQIQGGGVLSESDINAFKARVGENAFNEMRNYLTGESRGTLTASQKSALRQLATGLQAKMAEERDYQLMGAIENALVDNPRLVRDGKIDPSIQKRLKRYGFEAKIEDGIATLSKPMGKKREDVRSDSEGKLPAASGEQEVTKVIEQIKDPQVKAQAEAALQAFAGREVPQEVINRIKQAAGAK